MVVLSKAKKGAKKMGKTYRKDPMQDEYDAEDKLMNLYDELASQWALKVESNKRNKARA